MVNCHCPCASDSSLNPKSVMRLVSMIVLKCCDLPSLNWFNQICVYIIIYLYVFRRKS